MKKSKTSVDKIYKLKRETAPLSYLLPSRSKKRSPLLYWDEQKGINRPIRYAVNQKTPFEDEQDGHAIVEPIIFENGFLSVSRTNPVLQEFLDLHPMKNRVFVEVDSERDAEEEVEAIITEVDALSKAREIAKDIQQLEIVARVLLGKNTSKMSSAELKRDVLIAAKRNPKRFMDVISEDTLSFRSTVQAFVEYKVIVFKNGREVYFNLDTNRRRMTVLPMDSEDPSIPLMSFFKTKEGDEIFKELEKELDRKKSL